MCKYRFVFVIFYQNINLLYLLIKSSFNWSSFRFRQTLALQCNFKCELSALLNAEGSIALQMAVLVSVVLNLADVEQCSSVIKC